MKVLDFFGGTLKSFHYKKVLKCNTLIKVGVQILEIFLLEFLGARPGNAQAEPAFLPTLARLGSLLKVSSKKIINRLK